MSFSFVVQVIKHILRTDALCFRDMKSSEFIALRFLLERYKARVPSCNLVIY